MKLRFLKVQAFGPYANAQTIDFTAFGDSPMFLINGPTGAGKSTILDAICFAFYGTTSDRSREAAGMRNALTQQSLLTEVELVFEISGNQWKIRRVPNQTRKKTKGEGYTEQKPEAQLYSIDEHGVESIVIPKKHTEVTQKIIELTGLNDEQFRQVMVLPQGQFRALLLAKSNEREEILSTLFGTSIYKNIEQKLKDASSEMKTEADSYKNQLATILDGVEIEDQAALREKIKQTKPDLLQLKEKSKKYEKEFEQSLEILSSSKELQATFQKLQKQETELARLKFLSAGIAGKKLLISRNEEGKSIAKYHDVLTEARKNRDAQAQELKTIMKNQTSVCEKLIALEKQKSDSDKKEKLTEDKKIRLSQLISYKELLTNLEPKRLSLKNSIAKTGKTREKLLKVSQSFDEAKKQEADLTELIKKISLETKTATVLKTQILELERRYEIHAKYCTLVAEKTALDSDLQKNQVTLEKQVVRVNEVSRKLASLEYQWHLSQAAILAKTLDDNAPCPVCGSKDHPVLATTKGEIVDKDLVDTQRKAFRSEEKQQHQIEQTITACRQKADLITQECQELSTTLGPATDESLEKSKRKLTEKKKELLQLEQSIAQMDKAEKKLETVQTSSKRFEEDRELLKSEQQKDKEMEIKIKAELDSASGTIPSELREPEKLNDEIVRHNKEIEASNSERQRLLKSVEDEQKSNQQLLAKQAVLSAQLDEMEATIEKHETQWELALKKSSFKDQEEYLSSVLSDLEITEMKNEVSIHAENLANLTGATGQLRLNIGDKDKPDLNLAEERLKVSRDVREKNAKELKTLENKLEQLIELDKRINVINTKYESLQQSYGVIGRLADIAGGQPPARINFQRFVLGVLLDDVLLEASSRLKVMTEGRYELRRSGGIAGNKVTGLDLNVMDAYTGQERPVSTLSGGESFLAALSLALGLSDVVQAYSGGIRLDTLFIDEGFGSLDPGALDLAVQTLVDLQSRGRMIGVISHVEQMKEQIAKRIDIKTNVLGNTLSIAS